MESILINYSQFATFLTFDFLFGFFNYVSLIYNLLNLIYQLLFFVSNIKLFDGIYYGFSFLKIK